jgi:hypothetical protein
LCLSSFELGFMHSFISIRFVTNMYSATFKDSWIPELLDCPILGLYNSSFLKQLCRSRLTQSSQISSPSGAGQHRDFYTVFPSAPSLNGPYMQIQIQAILLDLTCMLPDYCNLIYLPCSLLLQIFSLHHYF